MLKAIERLMRKVARKPKEVARKPKGYYDTEFRKGSECAPAKRRRKHHEEQLQQEYDAITYAEWSNSYR